MLTGKELTARIAKISGEDVILMFSMGKESICCFYELKKHFKRVHLIYQYLHPDLEFVNQSRRYFEKKFQQPIHFMPHIGLFRMLREGVFQTPEMAIIMEVVEMPVFTYKNYYDFLREDMKIPNAFIALGVRMNDSPTRRMNIKVNGAINKKNKSFFPIYDWTNDDIRACLSDNKVKLPVDYDIFGKSLDGVDYRFAKPIKDNFPADFEKLKELFPLIELEILKYENYK